MMNKNFKLFRLAWDVVTFKAETRWKRPSSMLRHTFSHKCTSKNVIKVKKIVISWICQLTWTSRYIFLSLKFLIDTYRSRISQYTHTFECVVYKCVNNLFKGIWHCTWMSALKKAKTPNVTNLISRNAFFSLTLWKYETCWKWKQRLRLIQIQIQITTYRGRMWNCLNILMVNHHIQFCDLSNVNFQLQTGFNATSANDIIMITKNVSRLN